MNVAMIVFSTSGNTLRVANMLGDEFVSNGVNVQVLELSKRDVFSDGLPLKSYLREHVEAHDVLCIGSPVYNGHLQYHVKNILRSLPEPDGVWGRLAMPFVTWGGVDSGVALYEAAGFIKNSGRIPIAGMAINAEHQLTRSFSKVLNQGLPADEALPFVKAVAEKVMTAVQKEPYALTDIMKEIKPRKIPEQLKAAFTKNEKLIQRLFFPDPELDRDLCTGCGTCIANCPVQRLSMSDTGPVARAGAAPCIHCGECFRWCPSGAMSCSKLKWFEPVLKRMAQKHPRNVVYPGGSA